jgi:hypothetical protein
MDDCRVHVSLGLSGRAEDWWNDALAEGEHVGASGYRITLSEPRHVDVTGEYGYVVVPVTFEYDLQGKHVTQSGALFTVALRKVDAEWRLTAWGWAKSV